MVSRKDSEMQGAKRVRLLSHMVQARLSGGCYPVLRLCGPREGGQECASRTLALQSKFNSHLDARIVLKSDRAYLLFLWLQHAPRDCASPVPRTQVGILNV